MIEMKNLKLVKVASVRKHIDAHFRGEISYTEAVNRINEDANKALNMPDVAVPNEQLPCDNPHCEDGIVATVYGHPIYCQVCDSNN